MKNNLIRKKVDFAMFVLPLFIFYALFFIYPLINSFCMSFTDWNGIDPNWNFIGLDGYIEAVKDKTFLHSIKFTLSYALLYTVVINVIALPIAILVNMNFKSKNLFRTVIFTPFVLNVVTIGMIWSFIMGKLMIGLREATNGFFLFGISWLRDASLVIFGILIVRVWVSLGYFMVIYLAGLQAIPDSIMEAAVVDGATGWVRFKSILLPLLMPSITVSVFMSLIDSLRLFELLLTLTQGGPGSASESILLNIYREAFNVNRCGFASTKAIIFLVIILAVTSIQLMITKRREIRM